MVTAQLIFSEVHDGPLIVHYRFFVACLTLSVSESSDTYPSFFKILGCFNHVRNTFCCDVKSNIWLAFGILKHSRNLPLAFRWQMVKSIFAQFVMNIAYFSSRFVRLFAFVQPFGRKIVLINLTLFRTKVSPSNSSFVIIGSFSSQLCFFFRVCFQRNEPHLHGNTGYILSGMFSFAHCGWMQRWFFTGCYITMPKISSVESSAIY